MRSERGQASVEWIGVVVLMAIALTALARFAPQADAGHLAPELVQTMICAARGGCAEERDARSRARSAPGRAGGARWLVTVPPLVPVAPRAPGRWRPRSRDARPRRPPSARPWLRPPPLAGPLLRRARRNAGTLWRRSWMACLGYERVRYAVLHPEMRFPHQTIPLSEDLRVANDCLSPVDLVRDWDLLRGGP